MTQPRRILYCLDPERGGSLLRAMSLARELRRESPKIEVYLVAPPHQTEILATGGWKIFGHLTPDRHLQAETARADRARRRLSQELLHAAEVTKHVLRLKPHGTVLDGPLVSAIPLLCLPAPTIVLVEPWNLLRESKMHPMSPTAARWSMALERIATTGSAKMFLLGPPTCVLPRSERERWARRARFCGFPTQPHAERESVQLNLVALLTDDSRPVSWLHRLAISIFSIVRRRHPNARMVLAGVDGPRRLLTAEEPSGREFTFERTRPTLQDVISLSHATVFEAGTPLAAAVASSEKQALAVFAQTANSAAGVELLRRSLPTIGRLGPAEPKDLIPEIARWIGKHLDHPPVNRPIQRECLGSNGRLAKEIADIVVGARRP